MINSREKKIKEFYISKVDQLQYDKEKLISEIKFVKMIFRKPYLYQKYFQLGFDKLSSIEEFKNKVNEHSSSQEKVKNTYSDENDYKDKILRFAQKRKKSKRSRLLSSTENKHCLINDNQINLRIESSGKRGNARDGKERSSTSASKNRRSDCVVRSRNLNEGSIMDLLHKKHNKLIKIKEQELKDSIESLKHSKNLEKENLREHSQNSLSHSTNQTALRK